MSTAATQSVAGNVYERMSRVLDLKLESEADAVRAIGKGLSASAVRRAVHKLQVDEVLVAPVTTIRRRFKDNARFSVDESERVGRIPTVGVLVVRGFGFGRAKLLLHHLARRTAADLVDDRAVRASDQHGQALRRPAVRDRDGQRPR